MKELSFSRPCLMEFRYCNDVTVVDISLRYSPFWTLHPFSCNNVNITRISIFNPPSPNTGRDMGLALGHLTDGIDPDSSTNVVIKDCRISTGY
jgi:polygalacturonase